MEPLGTVRILIRSSCLWFGTSLPSSLPWCLAKSINPRSVSLKMTPPNCCRAGKVASPDGGEDQTSDFHTLLIQTFTLSPYFQVNGGLVDNLYNVHMIGY